MCPNRSDPARRGRARCDLGCDSRSDAAHDMTVPAADFMTWLRLLSRNRFAVQPRYWYIAAAVSVVSFTHTVLRWVHHGLYGDRIARTPIREHPVFVVGHWRTGTTLLHELMTLDDR